MTRLVSLIILVAIILFVGAMLIEVLAQFLVPMFLAVLLVVMFGPLHDWFIEKCQGRSRMAAGLTTVSILLIVLLPLTWILFRAASEGLALASTIEQETLIETAEAKTQQLRSAAEGFGIVVPTNERLVSEATTKIQELLGPAALGGFQFGAKVAIGLFIMVVSLYYFLADGPGMIESVVRLSPLDDRYERQLFSEFVNVSRAVVVATLLSAVVQGFLAGVAYWLAGFEMVVLLTALTMLLALVPFLGAAAVWVPCTLWLYFYDERLGAAIGMLVYGGLVVSMADNVIKPLVLAGQSTLHPLLALLSILGGVAVLGPIGIVIGPMLVAFLQALLVMLQEELEQLGSRRKEDKIKNPEASTSPQVAKSPQKDRPVEAMEAGNGPAQDADAPRDGQPNVKTTQSDVPL